MDEITSETVEPFLHGLFSSGVEPAKQVVHVRQLTVPCNHFPEAQCFLIESLPISRRLVRGLSQAQTGDGLTQYLPHLTLRRLFRALLPVSTLVKAQSAPEIRRCCLRGVQQWFCQS